MKFVSKALAGTVAAGAMAIATAAPANAQVYRDRDRNDGIGAEEVIAGAVILGGLAAILGSRDNDRYDDRRYGTRGYGYTSERQAVDQCVRAVERLAQRRTGTRANVYEIRDIDRERNGFEVKGRLAVEEYGYNSRDRRYRNSRDRRSYREREWDEGRFTCDFRQGRVVDIDYSGIRNL